MKSAVVSSQNEKPANTWDSRSHCCIFCWANVRHSCHSTFWNRNVPLGVMSLQSHSFFAGLFNCAALQWKFNKGVNETGYSACLCRKAPWACFTLEDFLYERMGSHPQGLSYTRSLWPQSHSAKCKSDNVDNCLLKITDCWLRSMTFPNTEVV